MSFITGRGLQVTDQDIRAYFATNPSDAQMARQAAALGLSAEQIAAAATRSRWEEART